MHTNHFASWFKLFGSIRNLAERPNEIIPQRNQLPKRTRNGIKLAFRAELPEQPEPISGSHPLHLVLCLVFLDKTCMVQSIL